MKLLQPFVPENLAPPSKSIVSSDETPEQEAEKKERFAELILKEEDPFKAGLLVYPDNTARALWVANNWPNDPDVLALKKSFVDSEGEISFLPTEADASRLAWSIARDEKNESEVRLKALELYGKFRGHIKKADVVVNTGAQTNIIQSNVMVVRDHGSAEEWEKKAIAQQRALKSSVLEPVTDVSGT